MREVSLSIFRKYDIRGTWQKDFNCCSLELLIFSILNYFKDISTSEKTILLGRDTRKSSSEIAFYFKRFACLFGFRVYEVGVVTTPVINGAFRFNQKFAFRVMITASHNPWSDNGFKLFFKEHRFNADDILKIKNIYLELRDKKYLRKFYIYPRFVNQAKLCRLAVVKKSVLSPYFIFLTQRFNKLFLTSDVFLDCMHGSTGTMLQLFAKLNKHIPFVKKLKLLRHQPFCRIKTTLGSPNPSSRGASFFSSNHIAQNKNSYALLFDGDGDRLGMVTDQGNLVFGDDLLCLFASGLKDNESVVADVVSSSRIDLCAKKFGFKVFRSSVGIANIFAAMKKSGASIGGEFSGHFLFFSESYFVDDGFFSGLLSLEKLSINSVLPSMFFSLLPKLVTSYPEKIFYGTKSLSLNQPFSFKNLCDYLSLEQIYFEKIDGVKVLYSDFEWILLRFSNTENCLIYRLQALNEASLSLLEEKRLDLLKFLL